jgi:hypothetical protein
VKLLRRASKIVTQGLLAALLASPLPARAVVPAAEPVRREIARTNVQAGRAQPLVLEVLVLGEAGEPMASGRAVLDPGGVARLHLTLADGRREFHERTPAGYSVTREGAVVERALPLLAPFELLQARSEEAVADGLRALGGDPEQVDLGMAGGADCWVLGGRDPGRFDANGRPSYWFDQDGRRPVRIDAADGVRFRLGPPAKHAPAIFFPAWYEVEAPGWPRGRVEVRSVTAGNPAAAP